MIIFYHRDIFERKTWQNDKTLFSRIILRSFFSFKKESLQINSKKIRTAYIIRRPHLNLRSKWVKHTSWNKRSFWWSRNSITAFFLIAKYNNRTVSDHSFEIKKSLILDFSYWICRNIEFDTIQKLINLVFQTIFYSPK